MSTPTETVSTTIYNLVCAGPKTRDDLYKLMPNVPPGTIQGRLADLSTTGALRNENGTYHKGVATLAEHVVLLRQHRVAAHARRHPDLAPLPRRTSRLTSEERLALDACYTFRNVHYDLTVGLDPDRPITPSTPAYKNAWTQLLQRVLALPPAPEGKPLTRGKKQPGPQTPLDCGALPRMGVF